MGYQGIKVSGYQSFRVSELQGVRVSGCRGFPISKAACRIPSQAGNHSFRHWVANWIAKSKRKRNEIDRMSHDEWGLVGGETLFIWKFSSAAAYYNAWYLVRLTAWLISPFVQTVVDPQRYYGIVTEYLATRLAYDNIGPGLFFQFMIIMLFSVVCGNNFSRVFFAAAFPHFLLFSLFPFCRH